jgi:hypothetical protein
MYNKKRKQMDFSEGDMEKRVRQNVFFKDISISTNWVIQEKEIDKRYKRQSLRTSAHISKQCFCIGQ